jgi:hypothetical protein
MLSSEYTTIYVNKYNQKKIINQFGDKLSVKSNEELKIPVNILPNGSGYKVKPICDFCKSVYDTEWRKYLKIENDEQKHCNKIWDCGKIKWEFIIE